MLLVPILIFQNHALLGDAKYRTLQQNDSFSKSQHCIIGSDQHFLLFGYSSCFRSTQDWNFLRKVSFWDYLANYSTELGAAVSPREGLPASLAPFRRGSDIGRIVSTDNCLTESAGLWIASHSLLGQCCKWHISLLFRWTRQCQLLLRGIVVNVFLTPHLIWYRE